MSFRQKAKQLLNIGHHAQFLLALAGTVGINAATGGTVWAMIGPNSTAEWVLLAGVFLGTTPISFPISALLLNKGLAWVEGARQKDIFDDPIELARKAIDRLISEGHALREQLPTSATQTYEELTYHGQRLEHWQHRVDAELSREAGRYACSWFGVDDSPEYWRRPKSDASVDLYRSLLASLLEHLRQIKEHLPVDRTQWLRVSVGIDISAGRALREYLAAGPEDDFLYGRAELEQWVRSVEMNLNADLPTHAHLFARETYDELTDPRDRALYVEERVGHLERIWASL
jgi:hypothetical protein